MPDGSLKEIARVFTKLGMTAFGGPAAHIAMMQSEVVEKRKWLDHNRFLDLVGVTNLIPGPNSTEMVLHCGYARGGWQGLCVAGLCFILPAIVSTGVLAWLYQLYGSVPQWEPFVYGTKPAVIAIILGALYPLGRRALKDVRAGVLGALAVAASLLGANAIALLVGCGIAAAVYDAVRSRSIRAQNKLSLALIPLSLTTTYGLTNLNIFLIFLKVGAILYGSGYVLFAFLNEELVLPGYLSKQTLVDAIAIGQFTPGPVLSTATFIGWQLNGPYGAAIATLGIFLPSFIFVMVLSPILPKMRRSKTLSAFLDGVNIASLALILSVCIQIGKDILIDWRTIIIAVCCLFLLLRPRAPNAAVILVLASLAGYVLRQI